MLGIVLGVILLLGLFVAMQMRSILTNTLRHELEHQGYAIAETTAEQAAILLAQGAEQTLAHLLAERQVHYTGGGHNTIVDYIALVDYSGEIVAQARGNVLPEELRAVIPADLPRTDSVRSLDMRQGTVMEFAAPLPNQAGVLLLGLAEDNIEQTVSTVTLQIASITLVMVAVGFVAAFFLTWILTRPISSLVEATQAVARGDFTRRVPRWANDEIGDLAEAFNVMTEALAEADRERDAREALRASYLHGVISAQEEERKRVARELHDSTSQSLTSLLVALRNLEEAEDPAALGPRIGEIRQVVSSTLEEVHTLAWQLRPSVLDDVGLMAALQRHIADYERRHEIEVDFVMRGLHERLPAALETSLYRIVQEGLTNIARHAEARHASVLIEQRKDVIRVIIEDDGVGFDPHTVRQGERSLGLQGIRERAELFGGRLTIESQRGQGASLFVAIPYSANASLHLDGQTLQGGNNG